jgi:hypothetical protein
MNTPTAPHTHWSKKSIAWGHKEPRSLTIDEYRQEQGVDVYDEKGRVAGARLVLKKKSAGPAIGKPPEISNQLFFMASYDVDRFRAFVCQRFLQPHLRCAA